MALGWVWWRAWSPLVARDAAALCVAGVALGDIDLRFGVAAWRLATSTFVLRGSRVGEYKATCDVLRLRQVGGLVTKLHARFHFGCVGFETAATCFLSFSIHQLCAAGC